MTVNFNIDVPKLVSLMDKADGTEDGKIEANIWNQYVQTFKTNKIKNYITTDNANRIFNSYFEKTIGNNNDHLLFESVYLLYNTVCQTLALTALNSQLKELTSKIKELPDKCQH